MSIENICKPFKAKGPIMKMEFDAYICGFGGFDPLHSLHLGFKMFQDIPSAQMELCATVIGLVEAS